MNEHNSSKYNQWFPNKNPPNIMKQLEMNMPQKQKRNIAVSISSHS